MHAWTSTLLIGIGATFTMDAWGVLRRRFFGVPAPDYALVGRWLGHMPMGRFRHDAIARSPAVRGERALGWCMHYLTGVLFAAVLPMVWGIAWLRHPTPGPALLVGVITVAAPFLLMQPGMGAGIAASRTARPSMARAHSLLNHLVFGAGLYVSALLLHSVPSF
ncbi:DUF2938 domain-containing protein [Pseudoxanthomonas sp. F37]|uniref:DUF2938 domain-containing protein n=1 Tax=Pseudoxanthomonas TaxID=83618 RepID=UPI001FD1F8B0|nr:MULTISPECIES: DUF2938 domain-containing protein [Pseudoxanthomonas]UOV06000.1 DUF2938 domain-containing protein [Pseudoxanthomonas mexicana]UOV07587.1 DUF2938 domain-containing protein [Pseudoxanthomonas sp. F37]